MALMMEDSDDDEMNFMNELENQANKLEQITSHEEDDLILCCCKKKEKHNEAMKFVCLYDKPSDWRKELFAVDRNKGPLIDDEDDRLQINDQIDKKQILGRQTIVHEILEFLTSRSNKVPRILAINGLKN